MIDRKLLRQLLTHLSLAAFDRFVLTFFNDSQGERFSALPEAGDHVFYQPILTSYGGSLHGVFMIHYSPVDLVERFSPMLLGDPDLRGRIARVWNLYKGKKGSWGMVSPVLKTDRKLQTFAFLTNLSGLSQEAYQRDIIPEYARLARRLRLPPDKLFVGSYDSFLDLSLARTREAFAKFIATDAGEIRITLSKDRPRIQRIAGEQHLSSGVLSAVSGPLEPVYVLERDEAVLHEFEDILRREAPEAQLERFLVANYRLIFGPEYDRIETQLWLRFPELDIARKKRRLDVFLRNSVSRDWNLLELKRSNVRLTGTARDIPVLANTVARALHQVRNYGRLLAQDAIKRRLARDGIEYYEPSLGLVIGRAPEIPHDQWRWLVRGSSEVKIATYDDLMTELRVRASDRAQVIHSITNKI